MGYLLAPMHDSFPLLIYFFQGYRAIHRKYGQLDIAVFITLLEMHDIYVR